MADEAPAAPGATTPRPLDVLTSGEVPVSLSKAASVTWRVLVLLAGLVVLAKVAGALTPLVIALFMAAVVTALAEPVVRRLARHMPKALAVVLTLLAMTVIVLVVIGFVVRSIVGELPQLEQQLLKGSQEIIAWLETGPLQISADTFKELPGHVTDWAKGQAGTIAGTVLGKAGSAFDAVTAFSVFAFAIFFFLHSPQRMWAWFLGWTPKRSRPVVDGGGQVTWGTMSAYVRGIILVALADAILVLIGLLILQIPLAPVLAVVVFFGALIPVIGAPIATLLAAVVALATEGPVKALLVVLLTVIVGSVDGDILQPLIMGHAVSLHPLAIVTILAVGTLAGGLLGALVCVPLAATVYALAKYLTGRGASDDDTAPDAVEPDPA